MHSKAFRLLCVLTVTLGVWFTITSYTSAQEFRATIIGQVNDPSGAAIPGARVTAVKIDTKTPYTAKANSRGAFSISYMMPGDYEVTIDAKGFKKKIYPNVTLTATQTLNLNVSLVIGSTTQSVTVSGAPGLLQTATGSGTSTVLNSTIVQALPNLGRDVWNNTILAPGVMLPGSGQGQGQNSLGPMGGWQIVNGAGQGSNGYFVNGAPVNTSLAANYAPSNDSVQEVQINDGGGAQYGQASGGNFNAVLKSGTNQFHGVLYDYYTESKFDANTWGNNLLGHGKPFTMENTWGGNIGGPVILPGYNGRNKTFFFFSVEGFHNRGSVAVNNTVPTAAERNGNFQGTGYTVYDPSTVTCVTVTASGCSKYGRTAFANDMIPSTDINTLGQEIINLYPNPTQAGTGVNYTTPTNQLHLYKQYEARVDHTFSPRTHFYVMGWYQPGTGHHNNNGFPGVIGAVTSVATDSNSVMADLTRTISNTTVLDLKAAFSRYTTTWLWGQAFENSYSLPGLNMPFIPTTPKQNIAPNLTFANSSALFQNGNYGTASNTWNLSANLAQVLGSHNLQYGFDFEDYQFAPNDQVCGLPSGSIHFGNNWTRENPFSGAPGSGNSIGDLLLGLPASGSVEWCYSDFYTQQQYTAYVNDNYKVARNITFNVGLRWEAYTSPVGRYNEMNGTFCFMCVNPYTSQINYANFPNLQNPLRGGVTFAGVTAPRGPYATQYNQWQPRLGLAWSITPKTVFRMGFGIYYNTYSNKGAYQNGSVTNNSGYDESTSYIDSLDNGLTPTNYFANGAPFPNGVIQPLGAAGGYYTDAGNSTSYFSPSGRVPWTQHYNAGIQRELPGQIMLEVQYVGAHSKGIYVYPEYGIMTAAQQEACYQDPASCNTQVPNPFYGVLPVTTGLGSSPTIRPTALNVMDPVMNGIYENNDPMGYNYYNSLQVRVQRNIRSANFIFNYSYGNNMQADNFLNYTANPTLFYGPWSMDVRHHISSSLYWPLPIGQGGKWLTSAHGVLGQVVNGWQWASTVFYSGGYPFAPPSATLTGAPGCTSYTASGGQTQEHWFNNNPACYQTLVQYQLRSSPLRVSNVRLPSSFAWNAAVEKNFVLPRERTYFQFRAECAFCSNTPQWGNPNTNINALETLTPNLGYSGFGALPFSAYGARSVKFSLKLYF